MCDQACGKGAGPVLPPGAKRGISTPVIPSPENNPCPPDTRVNRHVPEELDDPRRGADPGRVGSLEVPATGTDRGAATPATVPPLVPAVGPGGAVDGGGGRAAPGNAAVSQAIWSAVKGESISPGQLVRLPP